MILFISRSDSVIAIYLLASQRIRTRSVDGIQVFFESECYDRKIEATSGIRVASENYVGWRRIQTIGEDLKRGTEVKMIKKTREVKLEAGTEEIVAVNNPVEVNSLAEDRTVPVDHPQLQEKVNTIIHEWLTDIWLLTTGEEADADFIQTKKHNGRPLAIVCDGQMRLMESKPMTLDALRAVGIEMS